MAIKPWTAVCVAMIALPCGANDAVPGSLDQLKHMSVEELMNVEVTSVSRTEEPLQDAAAAIAVISNETIRRSGATNLPDALRLVPGIHVGEQTSSRWAVSARGFSSVTSEKLLVLSDTRSIYTPLYSGVFWDAQDYLLADIDRIEVIRGPGATLWGSNAVNGVINITTRSARDTQGTYAMASVGSFDRLTLGARYGGETAGGVSYRVFGRYMDRDGTDHDAQPNDDDWHMGHLGFRTDWDADDSDSFTVQGDAYAAQVGQIQPLISLIGRPGPQGPLEAKLSGGNLLARWHHDSGDNDMQLRGYYDYTRRDDPSFLDTLHTLDLDFQDHFTALERHEVTWGAAYRVTSNRNEAGLLFRLEPEQSTDQLFSGFIQDQVALTDALRLTVGTKLEHNDFSGFEVQPSVRLAWVSGTQTVWSAISRAVRVPTRIERDIFVDASDPTAPVFVRLLGNDEFRAEKLIAYEAGYRWQPLKSLSLDLATFYNDYRDLGSIEAGDPYLDPVTGQTIIPVMSMNLMDGHTFGGELQMDWQPFDPWQLTLSYSHIDMDLNAHGLDLNRNETVEDSTPRNIAGLRSLLTVARVEIDAQLRYQTRIRGLPVTVTPQPIPGYTEFDLRLGWLLSDHWRLSLMGQNLLHDSHPEFGPPDGRGGIERAGYLKADWRN